MKPCISEVSTMPASFREDVEAYAAAGCHGMEVWLTKLETALETDSAPDLLKLLEDKHLGLAAASYQGGLLLSQGEQRRLHFEHFKRRLDLCQFFGIPTLLLVADFIQKVDAVGMERAIVSLRQAAQWATGFGVTLALEFRGSDTFCSSLDTALSLIVHAGEPNLGVNLDVFHYYKGPSKFEDLDRLTKENLAFVQICDVAGAPRELMTDSDRIFPGDGDFQLVRILKKLQSIGYDGWVSLELWNPVIWQSQPQQVAEFGLASWNRLIQAVAEPGA
ncbi:MAG TPA: sugar phosphate isomerase/epimerase [Gemmataceae bacterium]|jgi:sugar phosphate isomerase/epimerase|nr:sugar phosphate isomerase/epimerase [Gemmataceae bacterium]